MLTATGSATFGSISPETMAAFTAGPIGYLTRSMARAPTPVEEMVIVTPSVESLRAVVPAIDAPDRMRHPWDGLRVVVDRAADRPRLVPARLAERRFPTPFGEALPLYQARQAVRGERPADQADTPHVVAAGDA